MDKKEFDESLKKFNESLKKMEIDLEVIRKQQQQIEEYNAKLREKINRLRNENVILVISNCFKIILHIGAMKNRYEDYSMNRLLTHLQVYFFMYAYCLMKKNGYLIKRTIKTS